MVIWKEIYVLHIGGIKLKLPQLKQGQTGRIVKVGGEGQLRRHFLDMGLIQGTDIQYIKAAPMGDPIEYKIWGYELTLRKDDAKCIDIELQENIQLFLLLL